MSERLSYVIVPALDGKPAPSLLMLAEWLSTLSGSPGTLLSVVEVPRDRSLSEGALQARRVRAQMQRWMRGNAQPTLRFEVRTAHSMEEGVRSSVRESSASVMLLPWRPSWRARDTALQQLIDDPPCDLAAVRPGRHQEVRSVLVPVRGGPHARLALRVAEDVARANGCTLTLLHVTMDRWDTTRRAKEQKSFEAIYRQVGYERVSLVQIDAETAEAALLDHARQHDMVVMGAAARDDTSSFLFGRLAATLAARLSASLVVVKTKEPVTASTFGIAPDPGVAQVAPDLSEVVDRWFAENTFHSHEFRNLRYLMDLKERQGTTISLALPTLNEENTVGKIVSIIQETFVRRYPLIDELIVIDSESQDRTVSIVEGLGVPVFQHAQILPQYGTFRGKGEGLWKSLQVTHGDIVVWIDSDITGFHPKFVYGLIGPLLTQPQLGFVKGFYRRPLKMGDQIQATGGGRVTELTARPLINLFYPELSGLVQPLAGEMAGRRAVLEKVPFFTGYGVETGLLIDILERFGLGVIGQTDLEERVHRNQSLLSLSRMANAIVQVVIKRLGDRNRLQLLQDVNTSMKLIHYSPTELFLEVQQINEHERPPIETLHEYSPSPLGRDRPHATGAACGQDEKQVEQYQSADDKDASN